MKQTVTNNTSGPLHFVTSVKEGDPVVETLEANESRAIEIDPEHPVTAARVEAKLITIGKAKAKAEEGPLKDATA